MLERCDPEGDGNTRTFEQAFAEGGCDDEYKAQAGRRWNIAARERAERRQKAEEVEQAYKVAHAQARARLEVEQAAGRQVNPATPKPKRYHGRKKAVQRYLDRNRKATDSEVAHAMDFDEVIDWKPGMTWMDALAGEHGERERQHVHDLISKVRREV
jgi:hypothetical protein